MNDIIKKIDIIEKELNEINEEVYFCVNALKSSPNLATQISKKLSILEDKMLNSLSALLEVDKEIDELI